MSANLTPALPGSTALAPYGDAVPVAVRPAAGDAESAGPPVQAQLRRLLAAVNRYKWLTGALAALGLGGGMFASTLVDPTYSVQSTILLTGDQEAGGRGPIREGSGFGAQGWMDLLRTNSIADTVVLKLALYVQPEKARDTVAFRNFQLNFNAQRFVPGQYALEVAGSRWTLRDKIGLVNEQGVAGDSIGRTAGFAWAPSRAALGGDHTIKFIVRQPREASQDVLGRLGVGLNQGSNLIRLTLNGNAAQKPAETLNAWNEQFIQLATGVKNARVSQQYQALEEQRATAERDLAEKERAYEQYRVQIIDQPSDALAIQQGGVGGAPLVQLDPLTANYNSNKFQLEAVRRQREQLQRVAPRPGAETVNVAAVLNVDAVNTDAVASALKQSLADYQGLDNEIRVLRRRLQDITPPLPAKLDQQRQLATTVIPRQAADVIAQLQTRERSLSGVVAQGSAQLRDIPGRTSKLDGLRRDKDAADGLFRDLNQRFAAVQLAQRSTTPDVRVLDRAVLPSQPNKNTLPTLLTGGLVVGLGLGLGLSLLLDRVDRRFRYPEQVTHGLKLQVLGAIPEVDQTRKQTPEQVAQIVEAFRTLRMNVRYACAPAPRVTLTVTSPGPNDGKSLVASNLALSFAEGGWRTVLVDGDLRRGQLSSTFDLAAGPGLVEYLEGTSLLGEIIQETSHGNLALVATGTRHRRGPELLGTPRMQQLIAALAAEFDAVIVDSPPLGAGTDAYALGTATANVALVVRRAVTDLGVAEAKLQALDTLPVQVIGAVLNEVDAASGMYQHYAYDPEYVLIEDESSSARGDDVRDPERLSAGK